MRPVLEAGYVYIAQPPIYGVKVGSEIKEYIQPGANQEVELQAAIERYSNGRSKPSVQRYKGLGEMDDHQLWATTVYLLMMLPKQIRFLICLWEIRLNHVVSSLKKMRFTVRLIFNRILT